MMIDHSYMAIIVDGDVKYKCNNKRNWNQCNDFFLKNYKKISFFFLFSQGSNLHQQGIPVLWMH